MHLFSPRSTPSNLLASFGAILLGGCAVNPNIQGAPPVQARSTQPAQISAPVARSAQPVATTPVTVASNANQPEMGWSAAQHYVESVVTCKRQFTLPEMSKAIGAAGVDFSVVGAKKKGGEVLLTPRKPFSMMGLPVTVMRFDSASGYLVVDVATTTKAAVAALNSRKFKMVPGVRDYKGSMTSVIAPKKGEDESQQIVVEGNKTRVSVFCGPFFMD